MKRKFIAFDVGGTKVKNAVILEDGTIIDKNQYNTSATDLEKFLLDIVSTIESYRNSHDISGIGISLPGFINIYTGYAESAGNITALKEKSIKTLLEERVGLPIEVENDANCVALAEKLNGNAVDNENFICITIGTSIGGGIVIDGEILHGNTFQGGEFGFMITHKGQGKKSIWHNNGATKSLIIDYKKLKGIDLEENVEGHIIFEESKLDKQVGLLVEEWLEYICCGIFNLAVTLNPEKILLGGGVSAQLTLLEDINRKLDEIEQWENFRLPLEVCKHKNDAGMLGAVKHFLNREHSLVKQRS